MCEGWRNPGRSTQAGRSRAVPRRRAKSRPREGSFHAPRTSSPVGRSVPAMGLTCSNVTKHLHPGEVPFVLTSGQVIALWRFETAVQKVFAVTVRPGWRYPELIKDKQR